MLGNWTGTYSYSSKRIPQELFDQEVKFHINILHFDGSHFSGTVEDDFETGGTKGIGKVSGHIKNGLVTFVKEMPIQTLYFSDGSRIEEDKPHRKIYYSGKLRNNEIEGTWKFKLGIGIVKNRLAIFPRSKGTWKMKKET